MSPQRWGVELDRVWDVRRLLSLLTSRIVAPPPSPQSWRVELDRVWDVLGPFPIHAREQHFLSPAYPLDLSRHIDTTVHYPTSLTPTAYASWSRTTADPSGTIHVTHPDISWDDIRGTEGKAGLQHLNVLRGWLSVHPSPDLSDDAPEPLLHTELSQAAFFTILPPPDSPQRQRHVPEWHYGNIHALERPPVQLVRLPVPPPRNRVLRYEVIICAPYEIRATLVHREIALRFTVSLRFPYSPFPLHETIEAYGSIEDAPLQHIPTSSITPYIVDGTPFGDAIGVAVQSLDFEHTNGHQGYWSIVRASLATTLAHLPPSLSVSLLDNVPIRIAPTQNRIIPLRLHVSECIPESVKQLDVDLTCVVLTSLSQATANQSSSYSYGSGEHLTRSTFVLRASLPLTHVTLWTREKHVPIQASYFFAKSIPTIFLVKPPKEAIGDSQTVLGENKVDTSKCRGNEPILALHGSGVDIRAQPSWPDWLPRQKYAWIVMPQGRTSWGLDWHGPSAADAFAALSALSHILSNSGSGRWAQWGFPPDTRIVLVGHSNVVPAAGYIKQQLYVSWNLSRFAHFADPALRAVLDTSFTPDDNDLFVGNLAGKPVLVVHGGADEVVPPWHSREMVGILKTWNPDADVTYHEDPGKPHVYSEILNNEHVQAFLDRVYFSFSSPRPMEVTQSTSVGKTIDFTLTVAVPVESGSLNGWQIHALTIPGLLGRLRVTTTPDSHVSIRTTNVSVFSLDSDAWVATYGDAKKVTVLAIDDEYIPLDFNNSDDTILFARDANTAGTDPKLPWKVLPRGDLPATTIYRLRAPPRRLQSILSTCAPLTLLVPSLAPSPELSAATRIAHALYLFHALDARIVSIAEAHTPYGPTTDILEGNLVIIGCASAPLVGQWLKDGIWSYTDKAWHVGTTRLDRPSSAILFCQPHPYDDKSTALFVQYTDFSGLERAVRLFPMRTGVLSPDWLVADSRADKIGAAGVQGAGVYGWSPASTGIQDVRSKWLWNERMSWLE